MTGKCEFYQEYNLRLHFPYPLKLLPLLVREKKDILIDFHQKSAVYLVLHIYITMEKIERKQLEDELFDAKEMTESIIETIRESLLVLDGSMHVMLANRFFYEILIVDDDDAILDVTRIMLENEGYQVETSVNGEALAMLDNGVPDLIILDVLLSGEDGKELCRQLKADSITRHIPVMLFSAHSKAMIDEGIDHNYFLQKPFDMQEFL